MLILRQGFSFLLVGGVQVLLDWVVFVAMSAMGLPIFAANVCGRIAGACLGFWLNGAVTFRGRAQFALVGRPLRRFLIMWLVLTCFSGLAMVAADQIAGLKSAWLTKPFVEALLAVISFVVSRQWVYR